MAAFRRGVLATVDDPGESAGGGTRDHGGCWRGWRGGARSPSEQVDCGNAEELDALFALGGQHLGQISLGFVLIAVTVDEYHFDFVTKLFRRHVEIKLQGDFPAPKASENTAR